jgi:hypothetical protein
MEKLILILNKIENWKFVSRLKNDENFECGELRYLEIKLNLYNKLYRLSEYLSD